MSEQKKVYCKDCKNFGWVNREQFGRDIKISYWCWRKKLRDIYGSKLGENCAIFNGKLNCQDYKRKWWKFWL